MYRGDDRSGGMCYYFSHRQANFIPGFESHGILSFGFDNKFPLSFMLDVKSNNKKH
jgi:hypothetical protein